MDENNPFFWYLGLVANITNIQAYEMMKRDFNNKDLMKEISELKQQNLKIIELLTNLKTGGE